MSPIRRFGAPTTTGRPHMRNRRHDPTSSGPIIGP